MVQSRNPSERNKVGEKKKKSQSWLDSVVDAAGDFAIGLGRTAAGNVAKVGDVGGSIVKGMVVDPVMWAMDNPDEVAKTFVNPQRLNTWVGDNLFAGRELEALLRGQGGAEDIILAAMALSPVSKIADDVTKSLFAAKARGIVSQPVDDIMQDVVGRLGALPENPYDALYSGLRRETQSAKNLVSAREGDMVDALTGVTNRPDYEDVVSGFDDLDVPVVLDRQSRTLKNNPKRQVVKGQSGEADPLRAVYEDDLLTLGKGAKQVQKIAKGLDKTKATNEARMPSINSIVDALKDAVGIASTREEKIFLRDVGKKLDAALQELAKAAVKRQNKYSK